MRAGEGAGRAYLSSPIDGQPTFSDAKRGPARDGRGDEYGQRGGCGAVPAVPAAPREDRHEPDEDGAKSEVIADKEPCKAFNTRALEAAKGKIALTPTYLKYLNLEQKILPLYTGKPAATEKKTTNTDPTHTTRRPF